MERMERMEPIITTLRDERRRDMGLRQTAERSPWEHQKDIVRVYLTDNGWKQDKRCAKFETYKKKIDGIEYQVKFKHDSLFHDKGVARMVGWRRKTEWVNLSHALFASIDGFDSVILFMNQRGESGETRYQRTQDDKDNDDYLKRIGVL